MSSTQPHSIDPVAVALSTDVPLLRIFQHLGVKDLLSCRQVNRKWTAIAGIILKSRSTFIPYKKLDQLSNTTGDYDFEEAFQINLTFLSIWLRNNPHFPFLGFTVFNSSRWSKYQVLQDFARSYGHHFKRLRLHLVHLETVIPALGEWFNNIEELIIGDVFISGGDQSEERVREMLNLKKRGISLPHLRRLILPLPWDEMLGLGRELGKAILEVSPQITKIENFHPVLTDAVIAQGKLAAISHLAIHQDFEEHLKQLEKFARSGLKLAALEIDCPYDDMNPLTPCITEILQSSQDSLEFLKMSDFGRDPPTMPTLKVLCIEDEPRIGDEELDEICPIFQTSNPVNSSWPALETVRLKLKDCYGSSVEEYFNREDEVFTTVKTLEILCPFDQRGLSALAKLFPNLSCLRIDWKKCSTPYNKTQLHDLWTISLEIKELEIYNLSIDSKLDSFLTGYDEETCIKLRQKPNKLAADADALNTFRRNPSVVQLTDLRKLTIFFTIREPRALPNADPPPAPISDWYALGLMPKLRTRFQYDSRAEDAQVLAKALEPYASFVSVEHRWTDEVKQLFD